MADRAAGNMKATIYHNPRCSKSREALALLTAAGADVTVVEYLKTPPTADDLRRLFARAGMSARQGLRGSDAAAHLRDADDATVVEAMLADPSLIERPLVETEKGVVLARPPERVHAIL